MEEEPEPVQEGTVVETEPVAEEMFEVVNYEGFTYLPVAAAAAVWAVVIIIIVKT